MAGTERIKGGPATVLDRRDNGTRDLGVEVAIARGGDGCPSTPEPVKNREGGVQVLRQVVLLGEGLRGLAKLCPPRRV